MPEPGAPPPPPAPPSRPARPAGAVERDDATASTDFFGTSTTAPADASRAGPSTIDEMADFYRFLADAEFDGYCDLYATLARAIAGDHELLERIAGIGPAAKIIPVLLFAAVHDQLLAEPGHPLAAIYRGGPGDPVPLFRSLVLDRFEVLRDVVRTRTIQTNEVGRSAALLPALTAVHQRVGKPLALVEIGPSAGLNLLFDRYGYRYTAADTGASVRAGDAGAAVQLECSVRSAGWPPLGTEPPPVSSRMGIDVNPVDVRDDTSRRWLEACIWPMVPLRAERFRAAADLARQHPPHLEQGSALDLLPGVLASIDADSVPVVISTWVLAYFSKEQRAAVGDLLDAAGARRDLAAVTAEYPGVAPWVPRPDRPAIDDAAQGATVLGWSLWRDGTREAHPLAWTQAHGRWLDWVDAGTACAAPAPGR